MRSRNLVAGQPTATYRLIDRGELRAIHVGRLLRIDPDDLDIYLNREAST
jgi:excisionase family DNA binding protein